MRRGLRAVAAGLLAVVAGAAAGTAYADSGPVASPPSAPRTQTVSGVAANGVQLSVTAPAQLPLDLPGQQLPKREADVTVKDAGGQGYTGSVTMTLTPEGSGASAASLRVDHYSAASGLWETEDVSAGGSSLTMTDDVTVPAGGSQVLKLRLSPGTAVADDVRLSVAANGAVAVVAMPVTGPGFQASGLTAAARAGAPAVLSGKLTNPTDLDLQQVTVKLLLCSAGSAGCVAHASDVKVEVQQQDGGAWHTVPVADGSASSPMSATVVPDVAVPAGGALAFSVRVTVAAGAFGQGPASGATSGATPGVTSSATSASGGQTPGQPAAPAQPISVPLALGPVGLTLSGQSAMSGTLTVQPPARQPASSTPSSSPSTSATSSAPSATASATPSATDTGDASATAGPTSGPTSAPATSNAAASTPSASSSGNPTVLVAVGLLAVCLALVLWWVLMKRRERLAKAHAAAGHLQDSEQTDEAEH